MNINQRVEPRSSYDVEDVSRGRQARESSSTGSCTSSEAAYGTAIGAGAIVLAAGLTAALVYNSYLGLKILGAGNELAETAGSGSLAGSRAQDVGDTLQLSLATYSSRRTSHTTYYYHSHRSNPLGVEASAEAYAALGGVLIAVGALAAAGVAYAASSCIKNRQAQQAELLTPRESQLENGSASETEFHSSAEGRSAASLRRFSSSSSSDCASLLKTMGVAAGVSLVGGPLAAAAELLGRSLVDGQNQLSTLTPAQNIGYGALGGAVSALPMACLGAIFWLAYQCRS